MKIILNVKNTTKIIKPSSDNVILYDGKDWYVTTKQELFKEYNSKLKEFERVIEENKEFKKEVAAQIVEMSNLIKSLYSK